MLWRTEFGKNLPVFLACYAVVAVVGAAALIFRDVVALEAVQAFGVMLAWAAAVVYSSATLFAYFALGRDLLLHIGSVGRVSVLLMKAAVLGVLLYALHAVTFIFEARTIADAAGSRFPAVLAYLWGGKALSIVAFLTLSLFLSAAVKLLCGRGALIAAYAVIIVGVVIAQAIALWRIGAPTTTHFAVGVGGDFFTANLYANVLPLTLTGPGEGLLPPITGVGLLLNGGAAVILLALWLLLVRTRGLNFYAV